MKIRQVTIRSPLSHRDQMRYQNEKYSLAPKDLSNHLSCKHLTRLDLQAALGKLERPSRYGPYMDELRVRGNAHEQAYLEYLQGLELNVVLKAEETEGQGFGILSRQETQEAMQDGADVIYQARLADDGWSGQADFLKKVPVPSDLDDWSYEVTDPKLARETRAGTILQLSVYSKYLS